MAWISEQLAVLLQNSRAKLAILTNFLASKLLRHIFLEDFGTSNELATVETYFWFSSDH